MGKLDDFYKKAEADEKLKEALRGVKKQYEGQDVTKREAFIRDIIRIAKENAGIDLAPGDFGPAAGELLEKELAGVAGGVVSVSNALLVENLGSTDSKKKPDSHDWMRNDLDDKIYLA
jgi:hypothetical protein